MKLLMKLISVCCFFLFVSCGSEHIVDLSPKEFKNRIEADTVVLIDVRTPEEYMEGFIAGAGTIDIKSGLFETKIQKLDKEEAVYVYCAAGSRSTTAARILEKNGFTKIYNLDGGVRAWTKASYPLVKENNDK